MPTADLSSKTVPPLPLCPTCGKEMRLIGIAPTSDGPIYECLCNKDGDRLNWHPRHPKSSTAG